MQEKQSDGVCLPWAGQSLHPGMLLPNKGPLEKKVQLWAALSYEQALLCARECAQLAPLRRQMTVLIWFCVGE